MANRQQDPVINVPPPGINLRDGAVRIDQAEWSVLLPNDLQLVRVERAFVTCHSPEVKVIQVGRLWFPTDFWMLWDPAEGPRVALNVRVENGAPVAHSVTVIRRPGEPELTAGEYRKVKLQTLVLVAAGRAAFALDEETGTIRRAGPFAVPEGELKENIAVGKPAPGRGNRVTGEFLEQVATIYREAVANGDPPTQTVATRLNGSYSSAGRWVVLARRAEKLGSAKPGQRGEITKPKESE